MAFLCVQIGYQDVPKSPGQKVFGRVKLCATSVLSGTKIEATLVGEEKCFLKGEENSFLDTCSFLRLPIPLDYHSVISNETINPGTYLMPFEVELPLALPLPISIKKDSDTAEIKYYIMAKIVGSGTFFDYEATTDLQVIVKPFLPPGPPIPFSGESLVRVFRCCLNFGHVTIGARMTNTLLNKSNEIDVYLLARNDSKVQIRRVVAELIERDRWQARGSYHEHSQSLSLVRIVLPIRRTPNQLLSQQSVQDTDIRRELESGDCLVRLWIPETANYDFNGKLIKCDHKIRISLELDVWQIFNPSLEFAVHIGPYAQSEVDAAALVSQPLEAPAQPRGAVYHLRQSGETGPQDVVAAKVLFTGG